MNQSISIFCRVYWVLAGVVLLASPLAAAVLKVAILHPLLGELARHVGGDQVEVIDLIGPNTDPHRFEPKPENLKRAGDVQLYLVAGMGLESYLPKLKAIISNNSTIIEVGATLPTLKGTCSHEGHDHNHEDKHEIDPHWWQSIDQFRRATSVVAEAFIAASPANADTFRKNADIYRTELNALERWCKKEILKIPRGNRHLATAHAAFNYFCAEFGFVPHPVQGINQEQMPNANELAKLINDLKINQIAAIFPEKESNPKILKTLTTDTGIHLGEPLIADGTGGLSYTDMMRYNVTAIVKGLGK